MSLTRSAMCLAVGRLLALGLAMALWTTLPANAQTAPQNAAETVVIAAEDDWYPYGGAIGGQAAGLGVDLVRASFAAVGVKVQFKSVPYSRCLSLAVEGEVVACNEPARTRETESLLLWPDKPLFSAHARIYARSPNAETGLTVASLEGKRVLVTHGFEYGSEFDANPRIRRIPAIKEISVFRMLLAGRGDYLAAYEKVADHIMRKHAREFGGRFVAVGTIAQTNMYCAFSKNHPDAPRYLRLFNEGYAKLEQNGELKRIEERWR